MARIATAHRWGNKLSQRLWNGAGGGYDAFLIDVHLKKREERFDSIMRCCCCFCCCLTGLQVVSWLLAVATPSAAPSLIV